MKQTGLQLVILIGSVLLLAVLHMVAHNETVSFFILPLTLSIIFAYTYATAPMVFSLVILTELFSSFPPGVMTAAIAIPWVIRRLTSSVEIAISGTFLLIIASIVGLQLVVLAGTSILILTWHMSLSWHSVWYSLPVRPLLGSWVLSTLVVYILIIMWDGAGIGAAPQTRYDF